MRIAVSGCGAIGGVLASVLSERDCELFVLARNYQIEILRNNGLEIEFLEYNKKVITKIKNVSEKLTKKVDIFITAVKIYDLERSIKDSLEFIKDAVIVTTQNGIGAEEIISRYINKEQIISGIVMFGATFYPPAHIVNNFGGEFVLGSIYDDDFSKKPSLEWLKSALLPDIPVYFQPNIIGLKYLKLLINLNNAVAAVLGISMQEAFSDKKVCLLAIKLLKEAGKVLEKSGIILESLPSFNKEKITSFFTMPEEKAVEIFSAVMTSLSKEKIYGSILQSLKRGRPTEIDFINGEIVRLAKENNILAPFNERIVELVKKVEKSREFFTKEGLLKEVGVL